MHNHWIRETIQKIKKKFKKVEVPHLNKKPLARKRIFVQKPLFALLRAKIHTVKFKPQKFTP